MARQALGRFGIFFDAWELSTALGADSATSRLQHLLSDIGDLVSGTGDSQIDRAYSDVLTLTTTPTTLDLVGSSVLSKLDGQAISLVDIVAVAVINTGADGLIIGGSTNNIPIFSGSNAALVIPVGGKMLWQAGPAGVALVASTGDILRLAAQTTTTTCKVGVVGRSA